MLCSNCGKDIPFAGDVCPYCNQDKTADQKNHVVSITIGILGAGCGYWIDGQWGALTGFIITGGVVGAYLVAKKKRRPSLPTLQPTAAADQIRKNADLLKAGILTSEEFQAETAKLLGATQPMPANGNTPPVEPQTARKVVGVSCRGSDEQHRPQNSPHFENSLIYCPRCGNKTKLIDEDGETVESCPSCNTVWRKFLTFMADDGLWAAIVERDKHDVICPKCGYERFSSDSTTSRTKCPNCHAIYTESLSPIPKENTAPRLGTATNSANSKNGGILAGKRSTALPPKDRYSKCLISIAALVFSIIIYLALTTGVDNDHWQRPSVDLIIIVLSVAPFFAAAPAILLSILSKTSIVSPWLFFTIPGVSFSYSTFIGKDSDLLFTAGVPIIILCAGSIASGLFGNGDKRSEPEPKWSIIFLSSVLATAFSFFAIYRIGSGKTSDSTTPFSSATYSEVDNEVGCKSAYSDEKKRDIFKSKYQNRWMIWTGKIEHVSGSDVSLNIDGKGIQDLQVSFDKGDTGYDLKKGQQLTVRFLMKSEGGCVLPFSGEKATVAN